MTEVNKMTLLMKGNVLGLTVTIGSKKKCEKVKTSEWVKAVLSRNKEK